MLILVQKLDLLALGHLGQARCIYFGGISEECDAPTAPFPNPKQPGRKPMHNRSVQLSSRRIPTFLQSSRIYANVDREAGSQTHFWGGTWGWVGWIDVLTFLKVTPSSDEVVLKLQQEIHSFARYTEAKTKETGRNKWTDDSRGWKMLKDVVRSD